MTPKQKVATGTAAVAATITALLIALPGGDTKVQPFFAPAASINQPVSVYGRSATLQEYASRLWTYGSGAAPAGRVNTAFGDYGVPIYDAANATTTARVFQATWAMNLMTFGTVKIGATIPWNPTWKGGTGNDGYLVIVDRKADRVWELGGVGGPRTNCSFNLTNYLAGFDPTASRHLCLSRAQTYTGLYTADPSAVDGRGAGVAKASLVVRADEVASGEIRHALGLTIVATMFGPPCRPINNATAQGAGSSCGFYLPPATKLERTNPNIGCPVKQAVTIEERRKTVPEGMRFALDITDSDIDRWLDSRSYTGALRDTARIFAVALRDYGWVIAETGCYGTLLVTDSATVGPSAATWKRLGVSGAGTNPNIDLLHGLFTPERIYVVEPPKS